jgi:hypothetical protein
MVLASGSIFFSNIFLKQYLSLNQYYEYSLCLTIFALLTSFGAMGFEQVFLRLSVINKKRISFDWKIVFFLVISSILTSVLSATYLNKNLESSFFLLFSLSLGIVIIMLLYNTFRITSYFLISQLISNSWKLIVFLFTIAIVLGRDIFSFFLESITSIIWMLIIFSILISRNLIEIKLDSNYSFRYIFLFGLIFFISLFTLSFLGQGDRILIDSYFNKADFNNYFYLSSIFLFPFSLLQSYVGFKELVKFKSKPVNLKKSVNKLIIYSLILSVVLLGSSFFLGKLNLLEVNFNKDFILILALLAIGNIKMPYSLYSSIIGVRSTLAQIKSMNFYFIIISLFVLFGTRCFFWSVDVIPVLFVLLWAIRLFLWKFYSKKINYEV